MASFSLSCAVLVVLFSFNLVLSEFDYRLSSSVIPSAYDITIKPYLRAEDGDKRFTFDGAVNITLKAVEHNVTAITLHKDYIDILSCSIYDEIGNLVQECSADDWSYESETDKLTIRLDHTMISQSKYTLHLKYTGQIRDGMAGFYRVNYTDATGNSKLMGITQLQRIDARTVFPCFDEPALKATFRMHITRSAEYMSVFNTKLANSEDNGDGWFTDTFEATPVMSTYLVAFIVSEYTTRGDDDLSIVIRPEYLEKTNFAYQVGLKTIEAYNTYTKIPYTNLGNGIFQKAGTPKFPHNGMENWGLIIYQDEVLVHEPDYTDGYADKQFTITILVHETAHMWFGDSVTFAWWSYFWLNEAFARYFEYFMAHEIYPEYKLDEQFIVKQVHLIFNIDAVNSTQPMTSPEESVNSPSEIANKFSGIAYAKGATILRMIRNIMGKEYFDGAIREYLTEYQWQNTVPTDLFSKLKRYWPPEKAPSDLDQFFADWTEQVGLPTLYVEVDEKRTQVTLRQSRFLLETDDSSDPHLKYTIPITYTTNWERNFRNLTPDFYFTKDELRREVNFSKPITWIIFNLQQSNYHRVFYDTKTLQSIRQTLSAYGHGDIHVANRAQLIDDLFNFARIEEFEYEAVFQFLEYLTYELDYIPWYAAFAGMQRVTRRLTTVQQQHFRQFLFDTTGNVYNIIGFSNKYITILDVYNRNKLVDWLCKYKHDDCMAQADEHFRQVLETGKKPSPDFRETLYCNAVRFGKIEYYITLRNWYKAEKLESERELLVRAMGCTYHYKIMHYTNILIGVFAQEHKVAALTAIYTENQENITPLFYAISDTLEPLAESLGSWSAVANVIYDMADYFTTQKQLRLLEALVEESGDLFGTSVSKLHSAVDNVNANLKWSQQRLGNLVNYLMERNAAVSSTQLTSCLFLLIGIFYSIL